MAKYKAKIEFPQEFIDFVESVTAVGGFENFDPYAHKATIVFEANDLWELAEQVHELNDSLRGNGYMGPAVERPTEVDDSNRVQPYIGVNMSESNTNYATCRHCGDRIVNDLGMWVHLPVSQGLTRCLADTRAEPAAQNDGSGASDE